MAKRVKPNTFRRDRATELQKLANILLREKICSDIGPLKKAANQCRTGSGSQWSYELKGLSFQLTNLRHTIPQNVKNVNLKLTIKVSGDCEPGEKSDPFESLEFNIIITGKHPDDPKKKVISSWHLDRDDAAAGEGDGKQEFIHPCYHFQYGGRHMQDGSDYGTALILESPRIAHPPMDAILGIDFVLTNYFNSSRLDFREEGDYSNLLRAVQERIWRPYALALAAEWSERSENNDWPPNRIWPQLSLA